MNILIACDYRAPFGGNFVGSLLDLGSRLTKKGDRVVFLFPVVQDGPRPWVQWIRKHGYTVIMADLSLSDQEQITYLRTVSLKNKIDIIHLHFGIYSRFVRQYPKELKPAKVLIHDHMGYSTGVNIHKQRLRLAINSLLYAYYGYGLITVMKEKKNAYIFMMKKWYVPNGVSMIRNVEHFLSREETRKQLGIGDDQILVTLLGWDMKRKGVDIAVQAVQLLNRQGNAVVLGLIGGDTEKYHQFIKTYGVDPDSAYIRYIDSREDVYSLHRAADVFLSASRNESFPYAILEAISQNTPIAISDIPETKWANDYMKSSEYALEDPEACAKAIMRSAQFNNCDSNADEIVEKYSIEKWCNHIMSIYDEMMR